MSQFVSQKNLWMSIWDILRESMLFHEDKVWKWNATKLCYFPFLQPKKVCLTSKFCLFNYYRERPHIKSVLLTQLPWICLIINRPGVAGAVLQTPQSLIKSVSNPLWKYLQTNLTSKRLSYVTCHVSYVTQLFDFFWKN